MFDKWFKKLKYKMKDKKLTLSYFNNNLPKNIATKAEAECLTDFLNKLDRDYTTDEFLDCLKFSSLSEKTKLSERLVQLINAYLNYNLQMNNLVTDFVVNKIGDNLSNESTELLCKFGKDNLSKMQWTVEYYRYLIKALNEY